MLSKNMSTMGNRIKLPTLLVSCTSLEMLFQRTLWHFLFVFVQLHTVRSTAILKPGIASIAVRSMMIILFHSIPITNTPNYLY